MKGFILKPHEAQALAAGKSVVIWRALKKPLYTSHENPPRFKDTKKGDWFLCPDVFPTSDNLGMVIVECLDVGTYHSMGNRQFCAKHGPFPVGVPLFGKETFSRDAPTMYPCPNIWYKATDDPGISGVHECPKESRGKWADCLACWEERNQKFRWVSPVQMNRCSSRITLTLSDVRVRKPCDVTEEDVKSMGILKYPWLATMLNPDTMKIETDERHCRRVFGEIFRTQYGSDKWNLYHFTALATPKMEDSPNVR